MRDSFPPSGEGKRKRKRKKKFAGRDEHTCWSVYRFNLCSFQPLLACRVCSGTDPTVLLLRIFGLDWRASSEFQLVGSRVFKTSIKLPYHRPRSSALIGGKTALLYRTTEENWWSRFQAFPVISCTRWGGTFYYSCNYSSFMNKHIVKRKLCISSREKMSLFKLQPPHEPRS